MTHVLAGGDAIRQIDCFIDSKDDDERLLYQKRVLVKEASKGSRITDAEKWK